MRRPGFEIRFTPWIADFPFSSYLRTTSRVFRTFLPFFSTARTYPASFNFSAIAILKFENGIETVAFPTTPAFRSRVTRSATGSLFIIYQEDFRMPGIFPSSASSRKQIRQRLKSRIKPRGRPHLKQRRTFRLENFGFRFAFAIIDFFAMQLSSQEGVAGSPAPNLSASVRGHP